MSKASPKFWKCYRVLPQEIRDKAKGVYQVFQRDPWYPSLNFKRVHSSLPVYSVRITQDYRAVGVLQEDRMLWFWIGSHSEYNALLKQMKNSSQQ